MVSGSLSRCPYLLVGAFSLCAVLLGCMHPRDRALARPAHSGADEVAVEPSVKPAPQALRGPYDFHWRLSGERQAGPSQVFSTSEGIWLYFDRDVRLPAVFGSDQAGNDVLLHPSRVPPYLFVQGDWSRLIFRLGRRAAQAVKHTPSAPRQAQRSDQSDRNVYRAVLDDRNVRRVLKRWAQTAGWTFGTDHWALDVDIPVSASADLGSDFKTAVRALLASTEMSDRPVQPCFYTNKVLRVIGASQQCDPRQHPAGALRNGTPR